MESGKIFSRMQCLNDTLIQSNRAFWSVAEGSSEGSLRLCANYSTPSTAKSARACDVVEGNEGLRGDFSLFEEAAFFFVGAHHPNNVTA